MKTNEITFKGFLSPRYTQVPDQLFDEVMAHLSGAELKVLLYIIRRTFGFKKDIDNISLNQICNGITTRDGEVLDKGTGLSLSTVQLAIKGLLSKKCVVSARNRSKEKGDEPTTFSLNILPHTENQQGGIPKIGNGGYRKSVTQETVKQQTVLQHRNSNIKIASNVSQGNKGYSDFKKIGELLKLGTKEQITLPEQVKVAIDEVSKEFNDSRNKRSNETRVLNMLTQSQKNENSFASLLFEAKSITKQQGSVKNRITYFFSVLEDLSGLK